MESAKTWPKMPFKSCKGRCVSCSRHTIECWVDIQDILDGFVRKVKARGNVDNRCIVVAEPAAARPGVETYMERIHAECAAPAEEAAAAAEAAASSASASAAGVAGATRTAAPPAGAASSAMDVDDDDSYVVYRPSTQAGISWT